MTRAKTTRELERAAPLASQGAGHSIQFERAAGFNDLLVAARYRLANGLAIVLMPDRRAPIFSYHSWFRVGSKHEDPRRTGLAHLFEHLMFKGTAKHPTGSFDREMELRGAQTNAATWVDWTYYHEALAARADNLACIVDFESDRMANLALDEATFKSELEVVMNERRMSVDDSVMGKISETLFATVYREHPYRWPTIGALEHLQTTQLEDARAFYRAHYAPNNATIVIAGDLDPVDTLITVARGYAQLAPSAVERRSLPVEPPQTAAREVRLTLPTTSAQVALGYRAPAELDLRHTALELIGEALLVGDNARLYQRLVTQDELVSDVHGFLTPFADPGLYEFLATARPGVSPEDIRSVMQEELARISQGLTPSELEKAHNGIELGFLDSLKDADGCASVLGHHEAIAGDFSLAFDGLERLAKVTPELMNATARETFRPENCTTVIALPAEATT